jgi:diacylglycerol kinase family enzyme
MLKFGVISNPYAKICRNSPAYNTLLRNTLGSDGIMNVTHTWEELTKVCQEYKERHIETVGIVGGDGSIGLTISALYKAYGAHNMPHILVMRGGTINFLSQNLNISCEPLAILKKYLDSIKKKQVPPWTWKGALAFYLLVASP